MKMSFPSCFDLLLRLVRYASRSLLALLTLSSTALPDELHTPATGSAERKAIMDSGRKGSPGEHRSLDLTASCARSLKS